MKTVSGLDKEHFSFASVSSVYSKLSKGYGLAHKAIKDATTQEKIILSERGTIFILNRQNIFQLTHQEHAWQL